MFLTSGLRFFGPRRLNSATILNFDAILPSYIKNGHTGSAEYTLTGIATIPNYSSASAAASTVSFFGLPRFLGGAFASGSSSSRFTGLPSSSKNGWNSNW